MSTRIVRLDSEDAEKRRTTDGREEWAHFCEFCGVSEFWPTVFKAGPYWTHESCLIFVIEEGRGIGP